MEKLELYFLETANASLKDLVLNLLYRLVLPDGAMRFSGTEKLYHDGLLIIVALNDLQDDAEDAAFEWLNQDAPNALADYLEDGAELAFFGEQGIYGHHKFEDAGEDAF